MQISLGRVPKTSVTVMYFVCLMVCAICIATCSKLLMQCAAFTDLITIRVRYQLLWNNMFRTNDALKRGPILYPTCSVLNFNTIRHREVDDLIEFIYKLANKQKHPHKQTLQSIQKIRLSNSIRQTTLIVHIPSYTTICPSQCNKQRHDV